MSSVSTVGDRVRHNIEPRQSWLSPTALKVMTLIGTVAASGLSYAIGNLAARNQRPLEPREFLRVGAIAFLPTVAAMIGRAVGSRRDKDPDTTPMREALNFGYEDVAGPAAILIAVVFEGPSAIWQADPGLMISLSAAVAAGVSGHDAVMRRDQQRRDVETMNRQEAHLKALEEAAKALK